MDVDTGEKGMGAGPDQAQTAVGPSAELAQALAERRGMAPNVKIHASLPQSQGSSRLRVLAGPDDLTKIRRIKAPLAEKLRRIGVLHFEQIAAWTSDDVRSLSAALDLGLRIYQENWIEQAAKLALKRSATAVTTLPGVATTEVPTDLAQPQEVLAAVDPQRAEVPDIPKPLPQLVAGAASAILARVADRNGPQPVTDEASAADSESGPSVASSKSEPQVAPFTPLEQFAKHPSPGVLALEINAALEAIRPTLAKTTASFPVAREPDPPSADAVEAPAPAEAAPPAAADDLTLIRNMPARVAIRLEELGIRRFADIADFDADDVAALSVDCGLGDQINKECWIEQAAILASGRMTKAALGSWRDRQMLLVPHPGEPLVQDRGLIAELTSRAAAAAEPKTEETSAETSAAVLTGQADDAVAEDCSALLSPSARPVVTVLQPPKPREFHVGAISPSGSNRIRPTARPDRLPEVRPAAAVAPVEPAPVDPPPVSRPEPSPRVQEEAEVYFKPKVASRLSSMDDALEASGDDAGSWSNGQGPKSSDPGSLQSKLGKAGDPSDANPDDYAAYHRDIEEASVEIVRNKSGARMRNSAAGAPNSVAEDAAQSGSVSRFLKALRGH